MRESAYNVRSSQFAVRSSQFAVRVIYSLIPKTKRGFILFMLAVSAVVFAVLYYYANVSSFWDDEIFTVGSIRSELSFMDTFNIYAYVDTNSPLYFFITFFWYRIVPHTERALLSLSILFVIAASIIMGIIGGKLRGIKFGMLVFLFFLCNKSVLSRAAYELRTYSLLLFVTTMNLYFYLRRLNNESWLNIIFYGVTMCLLPYTHYVSVIFCFGMFFADCILIFKKRASLKVISSYFIGALLFLPWFILILPGMGKYSSFWASIPTLKSILDLCKWFCGIQNHFEFPFWLGVIGVIYLLKISLKSEHDISINFLRVVVFTACFMIIAVYILSAFIFPKSSFFVPHYFFALMPAANLLMALGLEYLYHKLKPAFKNQNIIVFTLIMFVFSFFGLFSMRHDTGSNTPYREVANIIYESEQNYKGKSIILATDNSISFDGWREMYLTADNTRKCPEAVLMPKNISDSEVLDKLQSGKYDRIYFSWLNGKKEHPEVMKWLHANYDFGDRPENKNVDYKFQILERRK